MYLHLIIFEKTVITFSSFMHMYTATVGNHKINYL